MKENSWVLVANAEKAKFYRVIKIGDLQEICVVENPERNMKTSDLVSDREGRTFNRVGITRHAYQPQTSEKEKRNIQFARELIEYLTISHDLNKFSNLYIIAEPHFLGVLRKHISAPLAKKVDKYFSKDLVNQHPEHVWEHCEIAY